MFTCCLPCVIMVYRNLDAATTATQQTPRTRESSCFIRSSATSTAPLDRDLRRPTSRWVNPARELFVGCFDRRTHPQKMSVSFVASTGALPMTAKLHHSRSRRPMSTASRGKMLTVRAESKDQAGCTGSCDSCGLAKDKMQCDGSCRIIGGMGAIPLFSWLPIKAYRPCPGLIESGGVYVRKGQDVDSILWGEKGK